MTQVKPELTYEDLSRFYGGGTIYKHGVFSGVIYTEGIQYLAEHGRAYWLLDAIASHVLSPAMRHAAAADPRVGSLHFWKLTVSKDNSAKLIAQADSPEPPFVTQEFGYTDFPLKEANIWASWQGQRWLLFLPSEY